MAGGARPEPAGDPHAGSAAIRPDVPSRVRPWRRDRYGHGTDAESARDGARRSYRQVVETKEYSCIEKGLDHKFYAPGVGLIAELALAHGQEYINLVSVTP